VAILDADKEGFLRSRTSLIQTIGRAARNVDGKAILYADRITGSMAAALDETARRRAKQVAYNEANGITPESVKKAISSALHTEDTTTAPTAKAPQLLDAKELAKRRTELHKRMLDAAAALEFEEAARIRDELHRLDAEELGLSAPPAPPAGPQRTSKKQSPRQRK
jgi:excinuclease ABC subunit B